MPPTATMPRSPGVGAVGASRGQAARTGSPFFRLALIFGALLVYLGYRATVPSSHKVLESAVSFTPSSATISRRVVAVADLHGDLQHAHNVLRMAGIIDASANWIGGDAVLASTGDIVDRGDDTIELYKMFDRLRQQALEHGGEVRNCLGNHEMMNALHDWRYVTPGDVKSFGGPQARRNVMSSSGWIGKAWMSNYTISQTVPLLSPHKVPPGVPSHYAVPHASFVHGGIHPEWAAKGLDHINEVGRSLLFRALDWKSPRGHLPPDTSREEMSLYDEMGPLWYRGYAYETEEEVCHLAHAAKESLGVRHLVMGHTPHFDGFVVRCDAAVLLIDTGISRAYGGEQSALIFDTELLPLAKGAWEERSTLTALYRGRRPKIIKEIRRVV
ncbi:Metallo-dependent phosphatase [Ceraceosorus guamensis]|uniref:Metallo-dependent phosphatase n=1 Tax=Ceraceosorus guamensis TaxID=1522189 RepID=A0A316W099_9BASI|nr:Metallo-dependent phosphatase [Ceraceosorus guamensis]PWN43162.1 Metallo-dependent phosphatase [Ceraceosorus guamensis]